MPWCKVAGQPGLQRYLVGRLFCLHLQHCLTQEGDCLLFVFLCEVKATAETQANRSSRELCHHPSCRRLLFIPLIALACDTTTPWAPTPDKQRANSPCKLTQPFGCAFLKQLHRALPAHPKVLTSWAVNSPTSPVLANTPGARRASWCCRAALAPAGRGSRCSRVANPKGTWEHGQGQLLGAHQCSDTLCRPHSLA